jgi:hypothetical protein
MNLLLPKRREIAPHGPKLVPLGLEHLPILRYILTNIERKDLYSISPSYFALTGRKGLWIYGDESRGMIIARHPNISDTLLFFPPFGPNGVALIDLAMNDDDLPSHKIQLARLSSEDADIFSYAANKKPGREEKLDWIYPVHILNIDALVAHKGKHFADFRNNLGRAYRLNTYSLPLDISKHEHLVRQLIFEWAQNHESDYSVEDLIMPTHMSLYLKKSSSLPIHGRIIFEDTKPVGFILWEETRPGSGQAVGLCNASISKSKGISEYTYFEMCRALQERGYNRVCVGGSEESGLDAFKRKMAPEYSVELQTLCL